MSLVVDAKRSNLRAVNAELREKVVHGSVTVRHAAQIHGLAAGLESGTVLIEGEAGDYFGALNAGARLHVTGNAGRYLADNMTAGEVLVNGDAGDGAGPYCYGGTIVVRGNAGDFSAVMNKGATIIISGNVGDEVATYMLGGDVIILGNAGRNFGNYLIRGTLYIAGEWESLGHNTLTGDLQAEDLNKLSTLFSKYELEGNLTDFKKITRLSEKPFYKSKDTEVHELTTTALHI
jgi:glutamate synthase domain-containing protein 3